MKKRSASGEVKIHLDARKLRKSLDISFGSEEEKDNFNKRWASAKQMLSAQSNEQLLSRMLDSVLSEDSSPNIASSSINSSKDENFICSKRQFYFLMDHCNVEVHQYGKNGHVAEARLVDRQTNRTFNWSSSASLADNYEINHKLYHAFLCSGMLNTNMRNCAVTHHSVLRPRTFVISYVLRTAEQSLV